MRKLEGGFINEVYLDKNVVWKVYKNDNLVGVSSEDRLAKEATALEIFGGSIAPRLISVENNVLYQEFVPGESYEERARRGEDVFKTAGSLLKKIHDCFVGRPINAPYFQSRFDKAVAVARPILSSEGLRPVFNVSWPVVNGWGSRFIHGDFWLGNILGEAGRDPKVIDWEFFGRGSPFEDFAIADLWIFREFPGSDVSFWEGYGSVPDKSVIASFLTLRCVEFLATTTLKEYLVEDKNEFYHNKVKVLKALI